MCAQICFLLRKICSDEGTFKVLVLNSDEVLCQLVLFSESAPSMRKYKIYFFPADRAEGVP